jgi:transcriptional regulator with XRE-family HTH domain
VANEGVDRTKLEALGSLIRARRSASGLSLRDLAERTKVSNAYLSQIERGLHEPSLSVLGAIAAALDVPLATLLARAGVLGDDAGGALDTEAAILGDPALSAPQRVALLSIYRSFVPPGRRTSLDK